MLPGRALWRRWILQWIITSLWCGLIPIGLAATYYAVKRSIDFDAPLESLRKEASPAARFLWVVRVGGRSYYRANIGTRATRFGVNVEDRDLLRAERVGSGELLGTYQATYLVRGGDSMLPSVVTIFRDVTAEGTISYTTENRGRKPILIYVSYIFLGSVAVVVFLNVGSAFSRRRKTCLSSS